MPVHAGEGFYYRGRKYRLKLIDDIRSVRNGNHLRLLSGRYHASASGGLEGA